jgi:hypothetical protein
VPRGRLTDGQRACPYGRQRRASAIGRPVIAAEPHFLPAPWPALRFTPIGDALQRQRRSALPTGSRSCAGSDTS